MEKILSLAKNRGFVFQGSEIYGGLANTWDYGPLGVELKNNVKKAWWKKFIQESPYNVGLDAAIFMNPRTWEASGHVGNFSDPMMDCKVCKSRLRADKLIEEYYFNEKNEDVVVDGLPFEELEAIIERENIKCPECGNRDPKSCDVVKRTCGYLGNPQARPMIKGRHKEIVARVKHLK